MSKSLSFAGRAMFLKLWGPHFLVLNSVKKRGAASEAEITIDLYAFAAVLPPAAWLAISLNRFVEKGFLVLDAKSPRRYRLTEAADRQVFWSAPGRTMAQRLAKKAGPCAEDEALFG